MALHKMVNGVAVPLTDAEIADFEAREAEHAAKIIEAAATEYKRLRASEYPTIDDLVVALIEEKEGRPQALNDLQARRAAIKLKYPKPTA